MEKCETGILFTQKNHKGSLGQWYPYSTTWENKIVAIIYIYGARDILLLFFYHQDTELESLEI